MIRPRRSSFILFTTVLVSFLAVMGLLLVLRPVYAAGIVITVNTDDDNWDGVCNATHCSLREAIATANNTGGEPVTITFAADYVITLTYQSSGKYSSLPSVNRSYGPVYVDGDRNDDGLPDVIINGQNLTETGSMGLWIKSNNVVVDGLVIQNLDCPGCWGLDIHGDNALVVNSRFLSNSTGVLLTNDAAYNVITNSVIASNQDDGILLSASYSGVSSTLIITPAHHNTIANSYIGTNLAGTNLGNANKGIIMQRGAHDNTVQGNVIAFNGCYAVHLRGGPGTAGDPFAPPYGNQLMDNQIQYNGLTCSPQAAVVNDRTHQPPGNLPTLSGGYDNLLAGNVISANTGMGMYNIGASPLITNNTVANNTSYGIYNLPDFGGTYNPSNAADDILSIPIIRNNTIGGNGTYGIYSLDTAPVDRYTLHLSNTLGTHSLFDVLQVWYGATEVLTGMVSAPQPITRGITVRILGNGSGWLRDLDTYTLTTVYTSGIWGVETAFPNPPFQYNNVSTWPAIREFEVSDSGTLVNHLTHTVQVYLSGVYTGFVYFSFDGLTTTNPISGDVKIPQWTQTGPYGRYQVAEINFTYDSDNDTLPDVVEGPGDYDGDGQPDYLDPGSDHDNDGISDAVEGSGDQDHDGLPNYLDTDSDGDGILDATEGTGDTDHDGLPDYLDSDSDGDGISDAAEGTSDSDHDGIPDYVESNTLDTDGDGTPDYLDTNSDGDGILDSAEGTGDSDGDGIPNYLDVDSDGIPSPGGDSDGDGIPDGIECPNGFPCRDSDGDGKPDYMEADSDGDGISDAQECPNPTTCTDTNTNGIPDYRETDSDGDGISDWLEAGCAVQPAAGGTCPYPNRDSDGDGKPDRLDVDSDGDGITDAEEYSTSPSDPLVGCAAGSPVCSNNDADGDGILNYRDLDSDGDGTPDRQESKTQPEPAPFSHPGVPAWLDPVRHIYLPIVIRN